MKGKVEAHMNSMVSECQSEQGGTVPEGSSKSPQKVDGIQTKYSGHDSAPCPGVAGKLVPGGGGSGGGMSGY